MKSKKQLINFEKWAVDNYLKGNIKSPIHLSGGNEEFLIKIFKKIKPSDWVFSTYRSHYHALLKGISESWLKKWILKNKSIHVMNKSNKFWTSAIVGGTLPIALGVAIAIKRKVVKTSDHVWCFVGDMTAEGGIFYECHKYALHNDLPITFIIEDNGLSTDTPTQTVWGKKDSNWSYIGKKFPEEKDKIIYYKYKRIYPHYGVGKFLEFKDKKLEQKEAKF